MASRRTRDLSNLDALTDDERRAVWRDSVVDPRALTADRLAWVRRIGEQTLAEHKAAHPESQ